MDTHKIQNCFVVLNNIKTASEKLGQIYYWTQTNHINPAEFEFLLNDLALDLINKSASTK